MKKGNKKQKLITVVGVLFIAIVIICGTVLTMNVAANVRSEVRNIVGEEVQAEIRSTTAKTDAAMQKAAAAMDTGATLADYRGGSDKMELLPSLRVGSGAYNTIFFSAAGNATDDAGNTFTLESRPYSNIITGSNKGFYYIPDDGASGKNAIAYVAPMKDGSFYVAMLDPGKMFGALNTIDNAQYACYAVIDKEQKSLFSGGKKTSGATADGEIWERVKVGAINTTEWMIFRGKVFSGQPYLVEANIAGETVIVFEQPVLGSDWTLLVLMGKDAVAAKTGNVYKHLRNFNKHLIALAIVLFVGYVVLVILSRSNSKEESRKLESKAETDLLTGCSNKVSSETQIRTYMEEHPDRAALFILIDIDNFKKINDTMGHAFGDEVLRQLGMGLRSMYRNTDIIGRLGGDEFCVFLKDVNDEEIYRREARKLITFFHGFEVGEYVKYSVTGSLGAVVFPKDGLSFEELYENADAALYAAKKGGKNRLMFFADKDDPTKAMKGTD
ncbi:MAG: GGDEF domain-containing protein [Lachnospiraceae bacterium]|nr:GGDEF domain-containing protein [Lachnospiraceae bacterium]